MMMAFDSSQSPGRLDEATVASVRGALRGYLMDSRDPAPLRAALEAMASDARRKEMLPEQLLVVLKDIWGTLAEVKMIADAGERVRMQQRVVTMCITEYFDD